MLTSTIPQPIPFRWSINEVLEQHVESLNGKLWESDTLKETILAMTTSSSPCCLTTVIPPLQCLFTSPRQAQGHTTEITYSQPRPQNNIYTPHTSCTFCFWPGDQREHPTKQDQLPFHSSTKNQSKGHSSRDKRQIQWRVCKPCQWSQRRSIHKYLDKRLFMIVSRKFHNRN